MIDDFRATGNRGNLNGNDARPTQTPTPQTVNLRPQPTTPTPPAPAAAVASPRPVAAPAAQVQAPTATATQPAAVRPATSAAPSVGRAAMAAPTTPKPAQSQPVVAPHPLPAQPAAPKAPLHTPEQLGASEYMASLAHGDGSGTKTAWFRRFSRKQWMLAGGVLLIAIGGGVSYALTRPEAVAHTSIVATKPKPKPVVPDTPFSPLTGMDVSADDAKRIVTGVMVENTVFARPQSGLSQAGVVFEAIAEAGITRYLALFQEGKPGNIGPVRSARPYYVDWARSFDAPLAHVGGSPDALAKIRAEGDKDLDQFYNSGAYRRISSRQAPHNVYTTIGQLNQLEAGKGWTASNFTPIARKRQREVKLIDPAKIPAASVANNINISISSPTYSVRYQYDRASNTYKRFLAGEPHIDAETHAQLAPTVVVSIATAYGIEADGYHSRYQITGGGKAYVFEEGTVTPISWTRAAGNSQYVFTGPDGKPFKLDPGQTWITMVADLSAVNFKP